MRLDARGWRRVTYTVWAPVYDVLARPLRRHRRRGIEGLGLKAGERVLLVGAGTGLDLDFIPAGVVVTAVDLTPAMLGRLRRRARRLGVAVDARVMDARELAFADGVFDAVVFHLILAVTPEPGRCAREGARVTRVGGRGVVLDKFVADGARVPWWLRVVNPVMNFFGTEVTRRLGEVLEGSGWRVVGSEGVGMGGLLKVVRLEREGIGSNE